jgi:RND superfamily putative drug exporter
VRPSTATPVLERDPAHVLDRRPRRPALLSCVVLVLSVVLAGLVLAFGPSGAQTSESTGTALPDGAQSAEAAARLADSDAADAVPALVVISREDGEPLTRADLAAVGERAVRLAELGLPGPPAEPVLSPQGDVATATVLLSSDLSDTANASAVEDLRRTAREGLPDGLVAQVTGGPAYRADIGAVFEGADVTLLLATAGVVAALLLLTYRSPFLWLVPLVVVGVGDRVAGVLVGWLSGAVGLEVDASAAGIISVLVFGAGTNYALLLVARYRDELRQREDRFAAMAQALRTTAPAILASGGTVALSLLTLLLADLTSNRGLGFGGAVGVAVAMAVGLVVLPAALVLPGRWLFWPFVPRLGDPTTAERAGLWSRLGRLVSRRPAFVAVASLGLLGALSLGALNASTGLALADSFRETPEAVAGQRTLERALPAGAAQPLTVVSAPGAVDDVVAAAEQVEGVVDVRPAPVRGDVAVTSVVLDAAAGTDRSDAALVALRERLADVPGADAAVGGETAEAYDVAQATARDTRVVVPLVLVLVFLVLAVLLRALLAPLLLVLSTVVSYFSALGAAWLVFDLGFGFPALDQGVPLLSFLFLVALGVDYSVFLIARTREDVLLGFATRDAVVRALAATGGVITSAGIVLAAVFAVLGVLPIIVLTQIGVIVGLGVLLDTLVVRTVLVPSLAMVAGERYWWPSRLGRTPAHARPTVEDQAPLLSGRP